MILEWKSNYQLEARNEKGLLVKFDSPIDNSGEETALSPMARAHCVGGIRCDISCFCCKNSRKIAFKKIGIKSVYND
jgi:hypothetical protein